MNAVTRQHAVLPRHVSYKISLSNRKFFLSSVQMANCRSPSRVLCCSLTSLAFVIIVPTLCIDLVLRLPPSSTSGISNTTVWDTDSKYINRTVRLPPCSVTYTYHTAGRLFSKLMWSRPISFKPPWLRNGPSSGIHASTMT